MHAIGICASHDDAGLLARAGADFVEEQIQRLLAPDRADADWSAPAAPELPILAANCFLPGSLPCVGPAVDAAALRAWATTVCARAARCGIRHLVFGSGGARRVPPGFSDATARRQFLELLRDLAPIAAEAGVVLVLEPLNHDECNLVNTLAEGAELVAAVDHPGLRLLADLYHMVRNGEQPADLREPLSLLAHVHVAEGARTPPGVAGDDFRPWLRELLVGGYAGAICIEARFDDLESQAAPAIAELRRQSVLAQG